MQCALLPQHQAQSDEYFAVWRFSAIAQAVVPKTETSISFFVATCDESPGNLSSTGFALRFSCHQSHTSLSRAPMLEYLVYLSTAVKELSADELSHLVDRAAQRNAEEGVTGLLLYSDGDFMQCIEGPTSAVDKIYDIIKADPLHSGIITLVRERVRVREFADWHMAFKTPDRSLRSLTCAVDIAFLDANARGTTQSRARALLKSFWNSHKH